MKKIISYLIGLLGGLVILLAGALWVFLAPLFQTDTMLAQIQVENVEHVAGKTCYLVSLIVSSGDSADQADTLLQRQSVCGDWIGLGYEFTLPSKTFFLMQKPGIAITNLVAFDQKSRGQTANLQVARYQFEFVHFFRETIAQYLKKSTMVKDITYDTKTLMQIPQPGAVIRYKLEALRQQVVVECEGCQP